MNLIKLKTNKLLKHKKLFIACRKCSAVSIYMRMTKAISRRYDLHTFIGQIRGQITLKFYLHNTLFNIYNIYYTYYELHIRTL